MQTPAFFQFIVFYGSRSKTVRVYDADPLHALRKARKTYANARKIVML